jgi:hypothetical protein
MMTVRPNPFELLPSWSEAWGLWNARCMAALAWLERSACLKGRYAVSPAREYQVIPASGYLSANVRLVPGSVVWGIAFPDNGGALTDVGFQLTDLQMGHQFFQEPLSVSSLTPLGRREGWFESFVLFPCPHPVVGDGLFRVEFWGPSGTRVFVVLGVAEVATCNRLGVAGE